MNKGRNETGFIVNRKEGNWGEAHVPSEGEERELRQEVVHLFPVGHFQTFTYPTPQKTLSRRDEGVC